MTRSPSGLRSACDELSAVLADKAPRTLAALRPAPPDPGATASEVERQLGMSLTDEVRAWFDLHAGADYPHGDIFPAAWPASVSEVLRDTQLIRSLWPFPSAWSDDPERDRAAPAGTVAGAWAPQYLRIACDISGCGYFLDLRPGPLRGCVRSWDDVDSDTSGAVVAGSLTELLLAVVAAIRDGRPLGYWEVAVVDGGLDWSVVTAAG